MRAEKIETGWLLVVLLSDGDKKKVRDLELIVSRTRKETKLDIRFAIVDGRPKKSASKL
jgi:hypothetical protein